VALLINTPVAQEAESTLQVGMIATKAIINSQCAPAASIITVSERGVFFANAALPTQGLKFSLTEWFEVVDFVNERLVPIAIAPEVEEWGPDWAKIEDDYNYFAIDCNGIANVYANCPTAGTYSDEWLPNGGRYQVVKKYDLPLPVNWKMSLCIRPGV
jgi:hypothetical protein